MSYLGDTQSPHSSKAFHSAEEEPPRVHCSELLFAFVAESCRGFAGVLIEETKVEEQLAGHLLLAQLVRLDAIFLRITCSIFVEQLLGVFGWAFFSVVIDRKSKPLTGSLSRASSQNASEYNRRGEQNSCAHDDNPTDQNKTLKQG